MYLKNIFFEVLLKATSTEIHLLRIQIIKSPLINLSDSQIKSKELQANKKVFINSEWRDVDVKRD